MTQVGLTQQIQSAIADPAFSYILWTRDLHFSVKGTIQTNYATLRSRQELLKRRAPHRPQEQAKGANQCTRSFPTRRKIAPEAPEPSVINMTTQDFHLPSAHVVMLGGDAPTRPNHSSCIKVRHTGTCGGHNNSSELTGASICQLSQPHPAVTRACSESKSPTHSLNVYSPQRYGLQRTGRCSCGPASRS